MLTRTSRRCSLPLLFSGSTGYPAREVSMHALRQSFSRAAVVLALMMMFAPARTGLAQTPALPEQLISVAEVRAIIEGSIAHARGRNLRLGVVVVDTSGEMIAGERMDGAPARNLMMATAKAFTAVMYRTTSGSMAELYKTSPHRYF